MSEQPRKSTTSGQEETTVAHLREIEWLKGQLDAAEQHVKILSDMAHGRQQGEAWQPIATAPKNADVVLLFCENEGVMPGYWDEMGPEHRWVSSETQTLSGGRMLATHWMPLPAAPGRPQPETPQETP